MAEGRAPIRVGTGYIEIIPKATKSAMSNLRKEITGELAKIGGAAAKEVSKAAKQGLATLPAETEKAARKAAEKTKKVKRDSAKDLQRIEAQITREFGEEAAKRFRAYRDLELKKSKALKKTSQETRTALRETVRVEEQAARQRQAAAERLEKSRRTALKQSATDHARLELQKTRLEQAQERLRLQALREVNREKARLERDRQRAMNAAHAEALRMLQDQQRAEARALQERRRMLNAAHGEALRLMRDEARERRRVVNQAHSDALRMMREEVAARRAATQAQIADIRRLVAAERAWIQEGIAGRQRHMAALRGQLTAMRRDIGSTTSTTQGFFKRTEGALRKTGTWFDQVGMSINEAGNILTTKFLAPLAAAGAALTTIGVKSGDQRLLGQLGLSAAGVAKPESAEQMNAIQKYAINTPFSIDVMHEYQMKLIRSVAGADKNWYSKGDKRTAAANSAAEKTTDLIMAIGDSMARAGNLNPEQFRRAMYAMDMIMDMDRAPTRNVKQLAAATGMPASELANLLGFSDAGNMWKVIGTPAAKGGGVSGTRIMNSMLNYWNPEKYGEKFGPMRSDGSVGSAEKMTSETISGRVQQMKERAVFELGNLFVEEDKDGAYKYTKLGEKLMGKDTHVERDEQGRVVRTYRQDGILDQVQDMAEKYGPDVKKFLGLFLESMENFISMVDWVASTLRDSPLADVAPAVTKFLVQWGPLILAAALATKVLGKFIGVGGRLLTPVAAVGRGAVQGVRGVSRARDQRSAARDARTEARSQGSSRREARMVGREAYRSRRAELRGGDSRGPVARTRDSVLGIRVSGDDQAREIAKIERQIEEARAEAARLRDELRQVNDQSLRSIQQALAGNGGGGSLQGAANQAQNSIRNIVTQGVQPLNGADLDQLRQEIDKAEASARNLGQELSQARTKVDTLNGGELGGVTGEVNRLKAAAEAAGKDITSANTRIGNLNGKNVGGVTDSVQALTRAAKESADQIGIGTQSASVSGRVENLKKRRLTQIIDEFDKLTAAARDSYAMVGQGTGAGSLAGRVGLLNGRSLKKITDQVDDLAKALKRARGEGDGLDGALDRIAKKSPGGGGSGGAKKKKARGGVMRPSDVSFAGVLPGYSPWVDNIPAILSPGEAVLRPEVTSHLGEGTINAWNELAIRGQLSRHARGGVVAGNGGGRLGLDQASRMMEIINEMPRIGSAVVKTMKLDGTSDALGGSTQAGILGTGTKASGVAGSAGARNFRGAYDWMSKDLWTFFKRAPTGVGQILGVLGGSLAGVAGEYFWPDVWKGQGNIVQRGERFMGHVFSLDTLGKLATDVLGGALESGQAIWDVVSDPFGAIEDVIDTVYKTVADNLNGVVSMVDVVRDVKGQPLPYAQRVYGEFLDQAEESMPNTKGLFDFGNSKVSNANRNGLDLSGMFSSPGQGDSVNRWSPLVLRALNELGLSASYLKLVLHRIGVESGGNPKAINLWDSNAKAGHPSQGLMQTIPGTFNAYAGKYRGLGITNPYASIYAGLNYARSRYGSNWPSALAGTKGYATGTLSASPGLALVGEEGPELVDFGRGGARVYTADETAALLSGLNGQAKYEIHIHEARSEPTPHAVMRALQQAEALYSPL
ncbi:transglycosylase SLT domain-containing protein [Streptomyces sp. NBC_00237]|uniref:lytic transglycosylase domain-containing protein n=1 Tax=Streptomyces sp. NBC_00237 TaxID=2975687 RepID=UPI002256260C|nr:transglycosylase SLT domain-containing protein [Streptomyces sp. NBC_00237]MCX5201484.1 transglycosylase SLT domain-containing protein [Streptomyces sp. NBC_00237]